MSHNKKQRKRLHSTKVQKRSFSTNKFYFMNNPGLDNLKKKLVHLREVREGLKQEHEQYQEEKKSAKKHLVGLAKKENNQTLTDEEQQAMDNIKETFPEFFDEEDSTSEIESESHSPEFHERKQVYKLLKYLNQEIGSNSEAMKKNYNEWKNVYKILSQKSNNQSTAESSSASEPKFKEITPENAPESAIANAAESAAESTLNKNTSDYIDSLPKEYNPFDDLGDD